MDGFLLFIQLQIQIQIRLQDLAGWLAGICFGVDYFMIPEKRRSLDSMQTLTVTAVVLIN